MAVTHFCYANSVIIDPREKDPDRRYKMAYSDFAQDGKNEHPGLCVAFSPDGIHWTKHPQAPLHKIVLWQLWRNRPI